MKGLILETSGNRSCLILSWDGLPIAFVPLEGGADLSKNLGSKTQALLAAHPSFRADFVAVGTGPGSYTGIRVGAAFAKSLAFGWNVPLLGFCSLQAFLPPQDGLFAVLVDAKMGGFYCLKGEKKGQSVQFEEPRLLSPAKTLEECASIPLISPHPQDIQKRIFSDRSILSVEPDSLFLAAFCSEQAPLFGRSALEPLPLTYLSAPGFP